MYYSRKYELLTRVNNFKLIFNVILINQISLFDSNSVTELFIHFSHVMTRTRIKNV